MPPNELALKVVIVNAPDVAPLETLNVAVETTEELIVLLVMVPIEAFVKSTLVAVTLVDVALINAPDVAFSAPHDTFVACKFVAIALVANILAHVEVPVTRKVLVVMFVANVLPNVLVEVIRSVLVVMFVVTKLFTRPMFANVVLVATKFVIVLLITEPFVIKELNTLCDETFKEPIDALIIEPFVIVALNTFSLETFKEPIDAFNIEPLVTFSTDTFPVDTEIVDEKVSLAIIEPALILVQLTFDALTLPMDSEPVMTTFAIVQLSEMFALVMFMVLFGLLFNSRDPKGPCA